MINSLSVNITTTVQQILDQIKDLSLEDRAKLLETLSRVSSTEKNNPGTQSARHNQGKTMVREVSPEFIMAMADVLTKSRTKYPEFNWALPTKLSTPYESLFRHLMSFQQGEDYDPEDGCHHMVKVAINAMFIHYHNIHNKEESDDRFFKKKSNGIA